MPAKNFDISWLEGFGNSKEYELLFVKSDEEPIFFAHRLGGALHRNFNFLKNVVVDFENTQVAFPLFFSNVGGPENAFVLILTNRCLVSVPEHLRKPDPLLTLSFLDDDDEKRLLYLFNKVRTSDLKPIMRCDMADYDYLVIAYGEKQTQVSISLIQQIQKEFNPLRCESATHLLFKEEQKRETNIQKFLKMQLTQVELSISEFKKQLIRRRMQDNVLVPEVNYKFRRFGERPTNFNDIYSNELFHRVDV